MRNLSSVCFALVLFAFSSCNSGGFNGTKKHTSPIDTVASNPHTDYTLTTPTGWTQENYTFPLDFAKDLPYKGYEDARFSPFWGYNTNDEFWAYVVIWWLNDTPVFNEKMLEQALQQYYTGLARKSRPGRANPSDSLSLAKVSVTKAMTDSSDAATYNASATIYDGNISMSQLDINLKIHLMSCEKGKATVIIYEISPKDYSDSVWQTLDKIKSQFKCSD